ncbi:hypothetical protein OQA88_11769 [Cercophora sp. LCS_1]
MTDSQLDLDSPQQRKRIAVACGRCRKRKIRCSGDMGQGQPCLNCKNAGADQCLFLRVSSREAPFLPSDGPNPAEHFGYSVSDARVMASRGPMSMGTTYHPAQGHASPGDVDVLPYRGPPQPYTPTSTTSPYGKYYPSYPAYAPTGTTCADDFDFLPPQSVDPMPLLPWRPQTTKPYAPPLYHLDTTSSYPYANIVHRPAPEYAEQPTSRLLPDPARTYSKPPAAGVNALAEAANYVSAYDGSGLNYPPSSTKEGYVSATGGGAAGDSLFGDSERSLQTQAGGFHMSTYSSSNDGPRREHVSVSAGGGGGAPLANGHAYAPSESAYAPALGYAGPPHGAVVRSRSADGVDARGVQGVSAGQRS